MTVGSQNPEPLVGTQGSPGAQGGSLAHRELLSFGLCLLWRGTTAFPYVLLLL